MPRSEVFRITKTNHNIYKELPLQMRSSMTVRKMHSRSGRTQMRSDTGYRITDR